MQNEMLYKAVRCLAGVCDHAGTQDGSGFNRYDADFGHKMAHAQSWSPNMELATYKLVRKYRGQLERFGIAFDDIPRPKILDNHVDQQELPGTAVAPTPPPKPTTDLDMSEVLEAMSWSRSKTVNTRNGVRQMREAAIEGQDFWTIWKAHGAELKASGYSVTKFNGNWKVIHWRKSDGMASTFVEEKPVDHGPVPDMEVPEDIAKRLLPHQIPSAKFIAMSVKRFEGAVDGSDLGSGKTYVALAVARMLGLKPVIVCPKAVIHSWHRAAAHMGIQIAACINYEFIRGSATPLVKWVDEIKKKTNKKTGEETEVKKRVYEWTIDKTHILFFDECHKMKNPSSQNCGLGLAALRQHIPAVGISGTMASDPLQMRFSGELCRLHTGKDFYPWCLRNGCEKGKFGWHFIGGTASLAKISQQIYPAHGSRIRIADIPDFPECTINCEAYDCDNADKINLVYNNMYKKISEIQANKDFSNAERQSNVLVEQLRARQESERLKVPAICEMVDDWVEQGRSVVVFTNFRETVARFMEVLKTQCHVQGGQKDDLRQKCIDDFQADRERIIIVNLQSGGAGLSLHDLNGFYPRAAIICPTWSAQDLKQGTGRIWRAGAKTKSMQVVFYAAGTIEEDVCEKVRQKIKNISALNDGDMQPAGLF